MTQAVHYESFKDASMRSTGEHFVVMEPDGDVYDRSNAHLYLYFTHRLLSSLGMSEEKDVSFTMRVALGHVRQLIAVDAIEPGQVYKHAFTPAQRLSLTPQDWKECKYQRQETVGLKCAAAHPRDRGLGVTTRSLCQLCTLPSTDILCDELVYPETVGSAEPNHLTTRTLVSSKCNIGSEKFTGNAADCVPQGNPCWRKVFLRSEATEQLPVTELLAYIDHLNTLFHQKYRCPLFEIRRFSTLRTIESPTKGKDAFEAKVQALGRLIEHMKGHELAKSIGRSTADAGSISQLSEFLDGIGANDAVVIQALRDVMTVRVDLTHDVTSQDVIGACSRLGISLPLRDFDEAWERIVRKLLSALRNLEKGLP